MPEDTMPDDDSSDTRQARGSSGQLPDPGLARDLTELARQLSVETSLEALLQRITDAAVVEIEAADYAGVSFIEDRKVTTPSATDPLVERIDAIQYDVGEGPCLTSLREDVTVRSNDLAAEQRWPSFASGAADLGVLSMLSVQLFVDGSNLGALNLYAMKPEAFDDRDESDAMLLAAHAAIALKGAQVEDNLRIALRSRDVIGQAKGILMERFKVDERQAFDLLIMISQRTHRKLNHVADELARTGDIPALGN